MISKDWIVISWAWTAGMTVMLITASLDGDLSDFPLWGWVLACIVTVFVAQIGRKRFLNRKEDDEL